VGSTRCAAGAGRLIGRDSAFYIEESESRSSRVGRWLSHVDVSVYLAAGQQCGTRNEGRPTEAAQQGARPQPGVPILMRRQQKSRLLLPAAKPMSEKWLQAIFLIDDRAPYSCKSLQSALRNARTGDGNEFGPRIEMLP